MSHPSQLELRMLSIFPRAQAPDSHYTRLLANLSLQLSIRGSLILAPHQHLSAQCWLLKTAIGAAGPMSLEACVQC